MMKTMMRGYLLQCIYSYIFSPVFLITGYYDKLRRAISIATPQDVLNQHCHGYKLVPEVITFLKQNNSLYAPLYKARHYFF